MVGRWGTERGEKAALILTETLQFLTLRPAASGFENAYLAWFSPRFSIFLFFPFSRRAAPLLALITLLGGCNAPSSAPAAVSSTEATFVTTQPRPTPHARPTPHPTPRAPARIVYGIQTKRPVLALTFDDGPDPTWTPQVLAILKQRHVPATFFMVGKMVRAHPKFAQMVKTAHFPIGNHTWSHPRKPREPQAELERTDAILQTTLGIKTTLFRPPYGIMDNGLARVALSRGQDVIDWNSLGADWDHHATARSIASKVLRGAKTGGITLLHDGGGNRSQTVAALPYIIETLRRRGYRFVTVPELLKIGPPLHTHVSLVPRPKCAKIHRPHIISPRKTPVASKTPGP